MLSSIWELVVRLASGHVALDQVHILDPYLFTHKEIW